MREYKSFRGREPRPPTAAEVHRSRELEESEVRDVFLPIHRAPDRFWEAILQAVTSRLVTPKALGGPIGTQWWDELRWQEGWPDVAAALLASTFEAIVRTGHHPTGVAEPYVRLSAIEHLLDVLNSPVDMGTFAGLVNEASERFRVGVRLEGTRFKDVTSEVLHQEIVRPALALLSGPKLEPIDALYLKAHDRLLSGDLGGAITAANSAVEAMLEAGGCKNGTLSQKAQKALRDAWITPAIHQSILKLGAFRGDSDAHRVGTDRKEVARLVVNLTGSVLLYLGRTFPKAE